jgi:hypothetical protein
MLFSHQGSFPAFAILSIASTLRSTSSSVVAQHDMLMRIAVCPLPLRSSAPACPIALNLCDDPPRFFRATERDRHLVQHHVVQDA